MGFAVFNSLNLHAAAVHGMVLSLAKSGTPSNSSGDASAVQNKPLRVFDKTVLSGKDKCMIISHCDDKPVAPLPSDDSDGEDGQNDESLPQVKFEVESGKLNLSKFVHVF